MSIHVEKTRFNFNTLTMEATVKAKALLRIVNYMNISRRKKLMSVFFFTFQFNYYPLVWMSYNCTTFI